MSEEKLSLFYPLQDGFSEAILLTRWNNSSTKHAYKNGFIRPKKGCITVSDRPSSSNPHRDSRRDAPHGHQEVSSPQRKSASSRHVTMWPFKRQTDQASTSSGLDKGKQLMSEARELGKNDDISDEWQKRFDKVAVGYKDVLRKINDNEKDIEEYFSPVEKEFRETNGKERKQHIEELEKEFIMVKELHEEVGDLLKNNKAENGNEAKEGKGTEELQELRIKFLEVLDAKIKNSSDKKETFGSWTRTIDRLYTDRELIKEGYYDAVGRDMFMIHNPTSITDRKPDEVKEEHCKGNDQIYKLLTSICDSLYPEFEERKRLGGLRAQIESIERRYREHQSNADGISVVSMRTRETAEYSDLLLKEVQRCIDQGEQVKQLRQEAKNLRQGLEKYSSYAGELEDPQQRLGNLRSAYKNVYAIEAIFKGYDKQKRRKRLSQILRLGRRGQPEQRRES